MSFLLSKGPYCGDISALYLISCPWESELPLLLAGTGPQVLLYELSLGKLLLSFCCFDGVRVHGICATVHPFNACFAPEPVRSIATVAVHGEGRLKLFRLLSRKDRGQWQLQLQPLHSLPRFSHWVLDALFLQESYSVTKKLRDKGGGGKFILAIGLSDNSLSLWDIQVPALLYRIESTERCLLYSMRLWGSSVETLRAAAGTIFNEVLIWKLGDEASSVFQVFSDQNKIDDDKGMPESNVCSQTCAVIDKPMTPLHRLSGHEGSIHRISWSVDGSWIISVSDDRSARIWKHNNKEHSVDRQPILGEGDVEEGPILYGHGGRVWDCHAAEQLLITASEDCTCRVWAPDGKHLTTFRGHTGRGIWRCVYDSATSMLITAGADSAIRVTSLRKWTSKVSLEVDDLNESMEVFLISSLPAGNSSNGSYIDSKSEYVRCISWVGPLSLVVATNQGCLHRVDLPKNGKEHWTSYRSGYMEGPIVCMDVLSPTADKGPLSQDDALSEYMIAVGNGEGQARLLNVKCTGLLSNLVWHYSWQAEVERKLLGIFWCKSLGPSYVFTSDPRGGLHVWSVNYDCGSDSSFSTLPESALHSVSLMATCQSPTYNQITCLDVCLKKQVLVFGEKRGSLVIASFPSSVEPPNQGGPMALVVLAVLKGAHGISGVSSILIVPASFSPDLEFFSTGKDGCICKFTSEISSNLKQLMCTGVEKVSAITMVDSLKFSPKPSKAGRKIAAGFTAGDFIVWDLQQQSELMRVPCGGWRRPFSYLSGSPPESHSCFAFVKDHAIHVHRRWIASAETIGKNSYSQSHHHNSGLFYTQLLHDGFHGKEIQSVQFTHMHANSSSRSTQAQTHSSWVATGGEDGTVRLTRFTPKPVQQLDTSLVLGEHTGGSAVRALAIVSHTHLISQHHEAQDLSCWEKITWTHDKSLLLSVGAKEVMTCWLLEWLLDDTNPVLGKDSHVSRLSCEENGEDSPTRTGLAAATPDITYTWLSSCRPQKSQSAQMARQGPESNIGASEKVISFEKEVHFDQGSSDSKLTVQNEEPAEDDLRYMSITAFSTLCCSTGLSLVFVVTASSDCSLTVQAFNMSSRSWVKVAMLKYHTTPVLALTHLVVQSGYSVSDESSKLFLLFSGATDGCIAVWDITTVVVRTLEHCSEDGPNRSLSAPLRPLSGRGSQGGRRKKLGRHHGVETEAGISEMKMHFQADDVASLGQPIHIFAAAHKSGVNCMSVERLQVGECLLRSRNRTEYVLVSGGDDGTLHTVTFSVAALSPHPGGEVSRDEKAGPSASGDSVDKEVKVLQVVGEVRTILIGCRVPLACAHYSAVKGVWTDGRFIFSTGLDQRLRCWVLTYLTSEVEDSLSNANGDFLSIRECAQSVIDVPEAAALHVEHAINGSYRIAVAGRGLQLLCFQHMPQSAGGIVELSCIKQK